MTERTCPEGQGNGAQLSSPPWGGKQVSQAPLGWLQPLGPPSTAHDSVSPGTTPPWGSCCLLSSQPWLVQSPFQHAPSPQPTRTHSAMGRAGPEELGEHSLRVQVMLSSKGKERPFPGMETRLPNTRKDMAHLVHSQGCPNQNPPDGRAGWPPSCPAPSIPAGRYARPPQRGPCRSSLNVVPISFPFQQTEGPLEARGVGHRQNRQC